MVKVGNIEVKGLSLGYVNNGRTSIIVNDCSFVFPSGSFTSLIGPSGCGKSTLLNAIAGHYKPLEGKVLLDGIEVLKANPDLGIVFQQHTLFPWKTVIENVRFGPIQRGINKSEANKIAREFIRLVGLNGYESYYPKMLSGGMQHRVEIARALANHPAVLLMDEPFGALDNQMRSSLQNSLIDIWIKAGVTIIFVTHDIDEAIFMSQRVVVMSKNNGKISDVLYIEEPHPRSREKFMNSDLAASLRDRCKNLLADHRAEH